MQFVFALKHLKLPIFLMNCYCSYASLQFLEEYVYFNFSPGHIQCGCVPLHQKFANLNEVTGLSELRAAVAATLTSFDVQSIAISATNLDDLTQNLGVSRRLIFLLRL